MESIESELLKILQDWAKKGDSVRKNGNGSNFVKHERICGRYPHPFMSYFGVHQGDPPSSNTWDLGI